MERPIEDSVAATVNINITKTYPTISSRYTEKIAKFKFTDNNIISIDIIVINIFFLFKTNPKRPIKNKTVVIIKM